MKVLSVINNRFLLRKYRTKKHVNILASKLCLKKNHHLQIQFSNLLLKHTILNIYTAKPPKANRVR